MKYKKLILVGILLLAAFLRLYKISSVPPALSWDEAAIGYDAYSIVETGKDQWGNFLPLSFKSFGEYKYPFHIYATSLFIKIFGVNEFGVRVGSALFGVLNIYLLYLLTKKLFQSEGVALLSAFLLTISPWHLQFSRVDWETSYALMFFLVGAIYFLEAIEKSKWKYYLIAFTSWGFTLFTYNAAKVFVPLFVCSLLLIYFPVVKKNFSRFAVAIAAFLVFLLVNIFNPNLSGLSRYAQLNFEVSRVTSTILYKTTHVYKLGWAEVAARQYFSNLSPSFLFLKGDPNPRHSIQTVGQLLIFDAVFIPLGIIYLLKNKKRSTLIVLAWLVLWPIPASIAREYPHASRAMFGLGVLQIVSALGLWSLWKLLDKYLPKAIIFLGLFMAILIPFGLYLKDYYGVYPTKYSSSWQYGYKDLALYIKDHYNEYSKIYVTRKYGEPQVFLLFYMKYSPSKYQNDRSLERKVVGDWVKVSQFDKFVFLEKDEMGTVYKSYKGTEGEKVLFAGVLGDFPKDTKVVKEINFLDGDRAFDLVEK